MAEMAFAEARTSYEEVWEECRANGDFDRERVKSGELAPETLVSNKFRGKLLPAATVVAIAHSMQIKLPKNTWHLNDFAREVDPVRY